MLKNICEEIKFINLYKESKPKYLLICSYTLGLGYIEHKLFYDFRRQYDTKIAIVTSQIGIQESFKESYSLSGVGTEYKLFQINDYPYAFHPKIFLFIDQENSLQMYTGGANFTYPGTCLNLDVISSLRQEELNQDSIFSLTEFLTTLNEKIIDPGFYEIMAKFFEKLSLLKQENDHIRFITNVSSPLISKMEEFISDEVELLRVISPYYDENLKALNELKKVFNAKSIEVLFNKNDEAINLNAFPSRAISLNIQRHTKL